MVTENCNLSRFTLFYCSGSTTVAPESSRSMSVFMGNHFNFTIASLSKLTNPLGKRIYVYDDRVKGLALSVTPKGIKSFLVYKKVNEKPIRVTLGRFPDMTIEQARRLAKKAIAKLAEGINPIDEKRAKKIAGYTLQQVYEAYRQTKSLKPGTVTDYDKTIDQTFPDWKDKPLAAITEEMVQKRHTERGKQSKARANNAFRVLRALFNFAKHSYKDENRKSRFPDNPVRILSETKSWFKIPRKISYLSNSSIKKWYEAVLNLPNDSSDLGAEIVRDYLFFVLFTGLRREEAASLKWENTDLTEKTFTLVDTKNNEVITLPMSEYVYDIFKKRNEIRINDFVFPGHGKTGHLINPTKQIHKIIKESGIHFTVHDLRRTFVTIGESLDLSSYTLKRLINHKINAEADVTAGYIIPNPERLRKATNKISAQILKIAAAAE